MLFVYGPRAAFGIQGQPSGRRLQADGSRLHFPPAPPDVWKGGTGNWSNPGNWTAGVPNGPFDVFIDNGNVRVSLVNLDIGAAINNLTIDSDDGLSLNNNTALSIGGNSISNAGRLTINGGNGTNSFLVLGNNVTLTGGGKVTLSTVVNGGGNAFIEPAAGGLTLTVESVTYTAHFTQVGVAARNQAGTSLSLPLYENCVFTGSDGTTLQADPFRSRWSETLAPGSFQSGTIIFPGHLPDSVLQASLSFPQIFALGGGSITVRPINLTAV